MNFIRNIAILIFMLVLISLSFFTELNASEVDIFAMRCFYNNTDVVVSAGSLRKTVDINRVSNNLKFKYHIENINTPNEVNDYVEIVDKEGHNITYSLKCEKL